MNLRSIMICLVLVGSTVAEAKPSMMKVDAIKQEWLTQIAEIAREALGKYGADFASATFLPADGWTLIKLEVSPANTPHVAVLRSGRHLLNFETRGASVSCTLVVEDPGGDTWALHCRIVGDRVALDKVVEGAVPGPSPELPNP